MLSLYIFICFLVASMTSACPSACQCVSRIVWCDGLQLTGIPNGIPMDTHQIYLYDNNITSVPSGVFSNLKDLQRLDLTNNKLTNSGIAPNTFSDLGNLKELILSENSLTRITKQMLSGVSNLERLYIEHNKIRSIARDTFSNMSRLVELKLGWNRISIFPKITNSPSLRRVCLEQNRISRLLGTFSEVKLEQLTLSGNQLTELAPSVFNVDNSNLRDLDVSNNLLQLVPRIISNMTSLQTLNLSQNDIRYIQDGFLTNLKQIKVLDLSRMKLTSLPKDFIPRGTFLNVADLSNNPWNCNCDIAWIPTLMMVFELAFVNKMNVQCSTPSNMRGRSLSSVYGNQIKCDRPNNTNKNKISPFNNPLPTERPLMELCEVMPCANGGQCYINDKKQAACRCTAGWKGYICTEKNDVPSLIPSEIPTSTKKVTVDPYIPKLFIKQDTLTAYSVEIILPTTGKQLKITVGEITSGSNNSPLLRREFKITPIRHNYVVTNLESGTRYNICISTVEFSDKANHRIVRDELCGDITTKISTTIPVNDRGTSSSATKTFNEVVEQIPNVIKPTDQKVSGADNSAITNPSQNSTDFQLLYPALGGSLVAFVVIIIVILFFVCYRNKQHPKQEDTDHVNYKKGRAEVTYADQEVIPMVNTQQRRYISQQQPCLSGNQVPLPQNDETYQGHMTNYISSSIRVSTPSKSGSLGRSSTSGGSVSGASHAYPVDAQHCCSIPISPMHSSLPNGIRYVTPYTASTGGYQGNGVAYNNISPYSTSQAGSRTTRGPDYMYRHPSPKGLPYDVMVDAYYVDNGVRAIPVHSNCTTVNHYHQEPIATTSVHPDTTFQPLSNPITNYRDVSPTHQSQHMSINSRHDQIGIRPLYSSTVGTYMSPEYCAHDMAPAMTSSFHDTLVM